MLLKATDVIHILSVSKNKMSVAKKRDQFVQSIVVVLRIFYGPDGTSKKSNHSLVWQRFQFSTQFFRNRVNYIVRYYILNTKKTKNITKNQYIRDQLLQLPSDRAAEQNFPITLVTTHRLFPRDSSVNKWVQHNLHVIDKIRALAIGNLAYLTIQC